MNGHEAWELLSAYLDAELSPLERGSVETHLAACAECREELDGLRAAKQAAAAAPRRALPPELLAGLEERLSRRGWEERWRALWTALKPGPVLAPAGAVAAALLMLVLWSRVRPVEEIPLDPLLAAHARYGEESLVPQEWTGPEYIERIATIDD